MAKQKRLVIGNWKMYVEREKAALELARKFKRAAPSFGAVKAVVAPPFPFIPAVADVLAKSPVAVGAQTLSSSEEQKRTGDVSAAMLRDRGVSYVLIGHSERRAAGESEEAIREQLRRAADAGLSPVLCVGEKERDQGGEHFEAIGAQLTSALSGFSKSEAGRLIVAYEPVWAIGKGPEAAMKPSDVRETAIFVRKILADTFGRTAALKVPVIYGASVAPENAKALIEGGGVSGFLVGHESVDAKAFSEIIRACN